MAIWVMGVVLCLSLSNVMAWTQFKDGQTYNIDYEINDDVWVDWEAPGIETTVNLLHGANITGGYSLQAFEDSRISMSGGSIRESLYARDNTRVTISGGSIGVRLRSYDSSLVNISGSSMCGSLLAYGTSTVNMSGGSISGPLYARDTTQVNISDGFIGSQLDARGLSHVDISGGSIGSLWAREGGHITISGGSIRFSLQAKDTSRIDISGGSIENDLRIYNESILTIHGSDFAVDGQEFGYGQLTSILGSDPLYEPQRYLTGTLVSGELINNSFFIGDGGLIILVPEPATMFFLGLGSLGLRRYSEQALRRKHRTNQLEHSQYSVCC